MKKTASRIADLPFLTPPQCRDSASCGRSGERLDSGCGQRLARRRLANGRDIAQGALSPGGHLAVFAAVCRPDDNTPPERGAS